MRTQWESVKIRGKIVISAGTTSKIQHRAGFFKFLNGPASKPAANLKRGAAGKDDPEARAGGDDSNNARRRFSCQRRWTRYHSISERVD